MYPLRRLDAKERKMFDRALRGASEDVDENPDVPGENEDETPDIEPEPEDPTTPEEPDPDPEPTPSPGSTGVARVVVANVQSQMSIGKKRADYNKLAGMGSILLLQEVNKPAERAALRQAMPDSSWHHVPALDVGKGERIALKKSVWDVQQRAVYFGSPKPRPGGVPRYLSVALVTMKNTDIQFLVVSTHYVAHAWCSHNIPNRPQRRRYWNRHHNRFEALVLDARSKGLTVIGGADFNRSLSQGRTKFHSSQDWLRVSWLDGVFGVEASGGAQYTLTSTQRVNMNSDHDALVAQLSWTAGSNALKSGYNWGGRF